MHILDECKKHLEMICPICEKVLKAHQLILSTPTEGQLLFICGCGFRFLKSVKLDVAVDHIE
jgi:C4-type Zn-finger protein